MLSQSQGNKSADIDRVRRNTATHVNEEIDRDTTINILHYSNTGAASIERRIRELDREWDIERVLQVNASSLAFAGLMLGLRGSRKWMALPAVVLPFLFQHGVQGWCPPLPLLRRLGIRTRGEIDREKFALKALLDQPIHPGRPSIPSPLPASSEAVMPAFQIARSASRNPYGMQRQGSRASG